MGKKTAERWIKGFILLGFSLYIFLCLISFSPHDPAFAFTRLASPVSDTVANFGGKTGAYFSALLFFLLGQASYLVIALLLLLGVNIVWGEKTGLCRKLLSSAGIMLSAAVFFTIKNGPSFSGGFIGFIAAPYLQEYFGENGLYLILMLLAVGSVGIGHKIFISPFKIILENSIVSHKEKIPLPAASKASPSGIKNPIKRRRKMTPPALQERKEGRKKEEKQKSPAIKLPSPITRAKDYKLPPLSLLKGGSPTQQETADDLELYAQVIEETLLEFGIDGEVVQLNQGPRVTMYEVQLAPGVALQKVYKIQDNLAMNLKTTTVRVVAPLANKSTVGIEVPNRDISIVYLRDMLTSKEFQKSSSKLTIAIGKNIMGKSVITDLKQMPHILIAGATGSGKTVCLNSFIASILYKATPEEVKFIMIDPKMVELISYNELPHLLCPVVVETRQAINTLKWLIAEMAKRYQMFSETKVRNIEGYNAASKEHMPYIVVVIDELADLMMIARNEIENSIIRLAQLSRAAGIHLILATQRPSVNVITGVIKANLPCRISFQVTSKFDSRTILDTVGSEKLLGRGDLLFIPPGSSSLMRIQGCLISDEEIESICNFIRSQKTPDYEMEIVEGAEKKEGGFTIADLDKKPEEDDLYQEAKRIVLTTKIASISMLQRRLKIGFNKAARLIEQMDEEGLLGPYREGKPRKVITNRENSGE